MIQLFTFLFVFISFVGQSQIADFRFTHIGKEKGLPNVVITGIVQDEYGFMWFSTQNGLCRYDGYNFKKFQHSPSDPTSISHNRVFCLHKDKDGIIWAGTEGGGVNRLDPKTLQFKSYLNDPKNPNSLCGNQIFSIAEDNSGRLYFGSKNNGLSVFSKEKETFTNYIADSTKNHSIGAGAIWNIFKDSNGTMWFSTWNSGLSKMISDTSFTVYTPADSTHDGPGTTLVGLMVEDKSGNLWIANWGGGLDIFNPEQESWQHIKHEAGNPNTLGSNSLWPITEDIAGNYWIGTYGSGVTKLNPQTMEFKNYSHDVLTGGPISGTDIWSLYIDDSGIIWVGTDGAGITKILRNEKKFKHYAKDPHDSTSLSQEKIKGITRDSNGDLWLGGWGVSGLNKFIDSTNSFIHYNIHEDKLNETVVSDAQSQIKDKISAITEDSKGRLWIGTYRGGLFEFDRKQEKFVRNIRSNSKDVSLSNDFVIEILEQSDGQLWIATYDGLDLYHPDQNRCIHFKQGEKGSISNNEINDLYFDKKGDLWVCTSNGLNRYNPEKNVFSAIFNDPQNKNSLAHSSVNCITQTSDEIYWIGTRNGISKFNSKTNQYTNYGETEGLCNNIVCGIIADGLGNLWISTDNGLSKFIIKQESFINYNIRDGIQDYEYTPGSFYKDENDNMIFGGTNGFNIFKSEDIKDNPNIPPLAFTDIRVQNVPIISSTGLNEMDTIRLTYKQKDIYFEFSALDFQIPEKNKYKYQLVGYDDSPINSDGHHYVSYTNLDPGSYTFRFWGSNNDLVWNKKGKSIVIIIEPPFWERTWFYVAQSIFFIALLGFSIYYNRSNTHTGVAKVLAFLSVFMVFEYLFVLIEPFIDQISQGAAFFKVILNLVLAVSIIPIEKLVEKRFTKDKKNEKKLS